MSKNTTLDENDNRCIYCGAAIESSAIELVPDVDDVEAWLALATQHNSDCEWVRTRAHREAEEDDYEAEEYDELYWREEEADETLATFLVQPSPWSVKVVTSSHIGLMKQMNVKWFATERNPQGAPAISLDQPYGNSYWQWDVGKMFSVDEESAESYVNHVHRSMQQVLQIGLEHIGTALRPGIYCSDLNGQYVWEYVAELHHLGDWRATLEDNRATIYCSGEEVAHVSTCGKPWSLQKGVDWNTADIQNINKNDGMSLVYVVAAIQRAIIERDYGITPF